MSNTTPTDPGLNSRQYSLANLVPKIFAIVHMRGSDLKGPPLGLPGRSVLLDNAVAVSISRLRPDCVMLSAWTINGLQITKVFSAHVTAAPSQVDQDLFRYCDNTVGVLSWRRGPWEARILNAEPQAVEAQRLTIPDLVKRYHSQKVRVDRIGDYPAHLKGFATNRHGGNQLQRERGFKGGKMGPAGPVRIYTKEQRDNYSRPKSDDPSWVLPTVRAGDSEASLKSHFQHVLLARLKEAQRRTGDDLGSVCNLIEDLGAVEVAKMLVDPRDIRKPPAGLRKLLNHNLARLTIEQAIIDFSETGLFTEAEVEAAKARLALFRKK